MRPLRFGLPPMLAAATLSGAAAAHHSFSAEFDAAKPITIVGTITKARLVNPPSWVDLDVKAANGSVTNWGFEFSTPAGLRDKGVTKADLVFGTRLKIEGHLAKNGGPFGYARLATFPDGRVVQTGGARGAPTGRRGRHRKQRRDLAESGRSGTRIIRLDGRPHLPDTIKSWNADSRGHWEGNTLVVDVANNNAKALFGRTGDFASENVHIVERYIFANDRKRYDYVARFEDPTVYARPWTATIPARRYTEADPAGGGWHYEAIVANRPRHQPVLNERMERICVENNGPFGGGAIGVPLTDTIIDR